MLDRSDSHDTGDLLMFENALRLFIDGDIADRTSWHLELNLIYDTPPAQRQPEASTRSGSLG